jgi:flagellin
VDQNIRNVQDGISWAQTAEGALDVVGKILQRSLTLATEASDGTLNSDQLASIGKELQALGSEINNIQQRTKFQGGEDATSVFGDCGWGHLCVNTGAEEPTHILAAIIQTDMTYCSNSLTNSFDDIASNIADGIKAASTDVADIQNLITRNATNRGNLGAAINSLNYAVDNMQTLSNNLADGISRIVDTDYAAETANLTKSQILQQAATSMLAQANQMPNVILTLLK